MNFKIKDKDGNLYLVVGTNFHMAGANPTIQLCVWSYTDKCWEVIEDIENYILVEE